MKDQSFSFEFFPAKTDKGAASLAKVSEELSSLKPDFFSVTYGAGGSTQDATVETVTSIQDKTKIPTAPHLSCIGSEKEQIRDLLAYYKEKGINRIVALRGDLPSGMQNIGEFHYANDLVEFIRSETGDHFQIEVAAYPEKHPQAKSYDEDVDNFCVKLAAGADRAITQYFFNADAYFHFVDKLQKRQIDTPILPGIMPISNFTQMARFSDSIGAEIPRWLRQQFESYGEDTDSILKLGNEFITKMCQELLDQGAPGLHFYSMNRVEPSKTIWDNLGLKK